MLTPTRRDESDRYQQVVCFYPDDHELIGSAALGLLTALRSGGVAIVLATASHLGAFETEIERAGIDARAAQENGTLVFADAWDTIARFLEDGRPDPARFSLAVGGLVDAAAELHRPIYAYGEMVGLLWDDGQVNAALDLERLWVELGARSGFSLLCAYPPSSHDAASVAGALTKDLETGSRADFAEALESAAASRAFVRSELSVLGAESVGAEAALVASELATNAVQHARSAFTVHVVRSGHAVRIAVGDAEPAGLIQVGEMPITASSGRGLGIVAALSRKWGVHRTEHGKVVWAEIALAE